MHQVHTNLENFITSLVKLLDLPDEFGHEAQEVGAEVIRLLAAQGISSLSEAYACPIEVDKQALVNQVQQLPDSWQTLGQTLLRLLPDLPWQQRQETDHPAFMAGHANAQIIGPNGLVASDNLLIGISLLAPHVTYPDHHHPPAEVYLVLTEGEWRQEDQPWHQPGAVGYVYNQPHVIHAMRSNNKPLLAIWCLPL